MSPLRQHEAPPIPTRTASRCALPLSRLIALAALVATFTSLGAVVHAQSLPNAPSTILFAAAQAASAPVADTPQSQAAADQAQAATSIRPPCARMDWGWRLHPQPAPVQPCQEDPLQLIVNPGDVTPLTPTDKLVLAGRVTVDPFNLITVAGYSGIFVAANAHSAYGPGLKGFARLTGYSLLGDAQGNFLGIYAIPVLAHEDPRYHRMPDSPLRRRILHALVHTVVTQHDDGSLMPNYATLITYPASAELSNLYVPGIGCNGPSTARRILLGYATDPSGALIDEFLPDVAKRVHIHVVFVQQILLQVESRDSTAR